MNCELQLACQYRITDYCSNDPLGYNSEASNLRFSRWKIVNGVRNSREQRLLGIKTNVTQ